MDATEIKITPQEQQVVEIFNGLADKDNPLTRNLAQKYAATLQKVFYTIFLGMPDSRWPDEIKTPRYPDIRDMFLTGVALGYSLRAKEKDRK